MKAKRVYRRNLVIFWFFTALVLFNLLTNLLGLWAIWHLSGYFYWLIAAPWTWFHILYTIKVLFENRKEENMQKPFFVSILLMIGMLIFAVLLLSGLLTRWMWGWIL